MDNTWICLHRKSVESMAFQNDGLWKVWTWCLMKASYKERWVPIKTGKGTTQVNIKSGQFIFGRKSASKVLNMKPTTIRSRIKILEKYGNIDTQNMTHYTIITINNWDQYQSNDNQMTTTCQPNDTNNKDNNINNIIIPLKDNTDYLVLEDDILDWIDLYKNIDVRYVLGQIREWNKSSPKKRKTKTGIRKHITSWLNKSNNGTANKPLSKTNSEGVYLEYREKVFNDGTTEMGWVRP